mmetsp:Transcript_11188/g.19576  ORF Transcript_11188/g.19576 Transcript_11188/m.19576 type:complete len:244 (+) Transcript_11188:68-799(+)|eukprot:CAMPEP_0196652440 /NCGR_PEP_ID=MMETSP1086-20130531/1725_1 /TAXON_ID=77921 /ORGANISM="Cyanoptyche  gloeocystis , Strain SAG4.97" /LENGTH=243 /DNA_ID=CAMNT_0041982985 /DNA_START=64 /DNA_END=795 /DNA_ORIENTATION=-
MAFLTVVASAAAVSRSASGSSSSAICTSRTSSRRIVTATSQNTVRSSRTVLSKKPFFGTCATISSPTVLVFTGRSLPLILAKNDEDLADLGLDEASGPIETGKKKPAPAPVRTEEDEDAEVEAKVTKPKSQLAGPEREKFISVETNDWTCQSCEYTYEIKKGDVFQRVEPGTQFEDIPESWKCPVCRAPKAAFKRRSIEISGFAENQNFGLGANTLTSGQKQGLIYGSLLLFFLFFILGYGFQ